VFVVRTRSIIIGTALSVAASAALAVSTEGLGGSRRQGFAPCAGTCLFAPPATQPTVKLTPAQQETLLAMRREEKLAHDVYVALGQDFDLPPLRRIPQAEARHAQAVSLLLQRYGIADPVADLPAGKFDDSTAQSAYDDLVARGRASPEAALAVGAEIEELDIADLRRAMTTLATAEDVKIVLGNLEQASRRHLNAFVGTLQRRGLSYAPKHLDAAAFQEIRSAGNVGGRANRRR
jgi:hypothetical protein